MRILLGALILLASGCASAAHDETDYSRKWDDTPRYTLLPYAWRTGVEGDATAGGISGKADEGESTTAYGGRIEAYLDRVALVLDGFWLHAGGTEGGTETDARYGRFDFSAAMRLVGEDPAPISERKDLVSPFFDGILGVRAHFAGLNAAPSGSPAVDQDVTWFEPMLGARGGVRILRRITFFARADASALAYEGFGSASWGAEAGVRVDLAAGLGAVAGARWAHVRFSEDSNDDGFDETELDLRLDGLWAGIVLEF